MTDLNTKELKKELYLVKQDLTNTKKISNVKYHRWIDENKNKIMPTLLSDKISYESDIKLDHHKYLKCMLEMNKFLEIKNKKMFQAISLRTDVTDKYVHFDTSTIKDIFNEINSKKTNENIWKEYFNINFKKLKIKYHSFNFLISTDGLSTSLNFIKNDKIESKNKKIKAKLKASKESKNQRKTMTKQEIILLTNEKNQEKKNNTQQKAIEMKEYRKKKRDEYKNLSKEEQEIIKKLMKLKKNKYEYIEDAVKDKSTLEYLKQAHKENRIVVGDPGMRSPLTLLGKSNPLYCNLGKIRKNLTMYNYTNRRRLNETKRIKYLKLIDNKKKQTILNSKSIKNYESELCEYNSKTLDVDNFNIYANLKIKLRKLIATTCIYNEHIKKLKWHGYINKKRHEDNLLNDLEHLYGSNAIFVLGDWSNSNGIKHISTPNMSMKKLLLKRFEVYLIDEFNTSKLHYVSEEKCEKIKIRITHKSGKIESRELHSVLTFKMSNRKVCINRDYNACLNMMKIVTYLLEHQKRPQKYTKNLSNLFSKEKGEVVSST